MINLFLFKLFNYLIVILIILSPFLAIVYEEWERKTKNQNSNKAVEI